MSLSRPLFVLSPLTTSPTYNSFHSTCPIGTYFPLVGFNTSKCVFSPTIYLDQYSFVPVDKIPPALRKVKKHCFTNWNPKISKLGMSSGPTLSTGPLRVSADEMASEATGWGRPSSCHGRLRWRLIGLGLQSTVRTPITKRGGGILGNVSKQLQYFHNLYGVKTVCNYPSDSIGQERPNRFCEMKQYFVMNTIFFKHRPPFFNNSYL